MEGRRKKKKGKKRERFRKIIIRHHLHTALFPFFFEFFRISISEERMYKVVLLDELAAVVSDNELPFILLASKFSTCSHHFFHKLFLLCIPPSS